MKAHFQRKNVGDVDATEGVLDGVPYTLWGMKEPDYAMMAIDGSLSADEMCQETTRRVGGRRYPSSTPVPMTGTFSTATR